MKLKNKTLETLLPVYAKLVNAEYEDYRVAIDITKDGFKVEDAFKVFTKLKDALIGKYKNDEGNIDQDKVVSFNEEFEKLHNTEQEVDISKKIPNSVLKSVKMTGIGAKTLDDCNLIEE
jgi:Zn-dependent M32 family carboxypeptidase